MNEFLVGLACFIVGGAVASVWWVLRRSRLHASYAAANARADSLDDQLQQIHVEIERAQTSATQANRARETAEKDTIALREKVRNLEEQRIALDQAQEQFTTIFKSAGVDALKANSEQFLTLGKQMFQTIMAHATGDIEKQKQAIDNLIKPIHILLEQQNKAVAEIEKAREGAYARIDEQMKVIAASHSELRTETGRLVTALRRPQQRGRWGELQLRNVVELAGMKEHCDFDEQVTVWKGDQAQRPDMIVNLPGGGVIVVDAKVAIDAYLDAIDGETDRDMHLKRHASQVESHVRKLAEKRYWEQFERTPNVVVMFMPLESALVAALDMRPQLQADAMAQQVLIATPTLLVALLRAVAYGWRQEDTAANAKRIAEAGQELYKRLSTFVEKFQDVGIALERGSKAYNSAIGSLERNLLPGARRFKSLNVTAEPEIQSPPLVEIEVRPIVAPELQMLPYVKDQHADLESEIAARPGQSSAT